MESGNSRTSVVVIYSLAGRQAGSQAGGRAKGAARSLLSGWQAGCLILRPLFIPMKARSWKRWPTFQLTFSQRFLLADQSSTVYRTPALILSLGCGRMGGGGATVGWYAQKTRNTGLLLVQRRSDEPPSNQRWLSWLVFAGWWL